MTGGLVRAKSTTLWREEVCQLFTEREEGIFYLGKVGGVRGIMDGNVPPTIRAIAIVMCGGGRYDDSVYLSVLYEYAEYCFVIRWRRRVRAMVRVEFWSKVREEWRLWEIQDARKGSRVAACLGNW